MRLADGRGNINVILAMLAIVTLVPAVSVATLLWPPES